MNSDDGTFAASVHPAGLRGGEAERGELGAGHEVGLPRLKVRIGTGDVVSHEQAQLATLLPLLSPGADLPPSQAAPAVKEVLEAPPASLLSLENNADFASWTAWTNSGLAIFIRHFGEGHSQVTTVQAKMKAAGCTP
ncbi:MAG: hypothetical protein NTV94_12125 [Planctomycetota bacterium]|nr:hypothetical protein [Planctomycetota bacterium]